MREIDPIDRELDAALATYADPGDDSALAQRVLAHVAEARTADARTSGQPAHQSIRRWLPWAIALPAAACLLFPFLSAPNPPRPSPRTAEPSHPAQQPSTLAAHARPQLTPRPQSTQRPTPGAQAPQAQPATLAANAAPLPKLDVFPTPRPPTPEEQSLAVVAAQTPTPELQALVEAQTQPGQPLTIATAHIPPLEPPNPDVN